MLLGTLLVSQSMVKHHFVFVSDRPAKSVHVAGTFNNWNKDANPMKLESDGRTWSLDYDLKFGRYQYKFVRDGSEWMTDPKAEKNEDDGNGNTNSILVILPPDFLTNAKRGDGEIATSAIEHRPSLPYFNVDGNDCSLTIRTRKNDVDSVDLVVNGKKVRTAVDYSDDLYDFHKADFQWDRKKDLYYRFEIKDGGKALANSGLQFVVKAASFKPFEVPKWVQSSVIYQIFPDRFDNGNKSNDPKSVVPWNTMPTYSNRYGGDVAGIEKRLAYLKDLGISAIYFNPIFKSPSNHRYEADDYMAVDPEIGTNAEFAKLTKALRRQGISTILDFAFNHTSPNSLQFKDLVKRGKNSPYKTWYFPKSFPIQVGENPNYEAWFGYPSMPKLNTVNPETRDYLLKVCRYWVKDVGIAGLRLDVANEVDMNFWRVMRPFVKSISKDTWILGEIWGDGNPWLQGDQFDSVMNYQFREAAIRFVAKNTEDATQFASSLTRVNRSYPAQVSRNMMNLLGSHDTPRFLTECGGDKNLAKLGAAIQFTWIGEPSLYYGDELGMEGGKDPLNRYGMEWSKANANNDMLKFYKRLIRVRKSTDAFATGKANFVFSDKDSAAFSREGKKDAAVVVFNRSNETKTVSVKVPVGVRNHARRGLFDAFSGAAYSVADRPLSVKLAPKSFAILVTNPISNSSLSQRRLVERDSVQRRANLINRSHINQ